MDFILRVNETHVYKYTFEMQTNTQIIFFSSIHSNPISKYEYTAYT